VLDHVIVVDTGPRSTDGSFGRGLSAQAGGHVEVRHALVEGSHESGVFGGGDGTELVLTDTVVRGTQAQVLDGLFGRGISIFDSAAITAERVVVDDNRD